MDFCGPRRKVSRLVLAALSVLIYDTASATDSPPTPTSVELEILRKGASATLNRLYSHDSEWDAVRSGIASGTVEWLQAVKKLYSVSDGGTAEQLAAAAGEALEHHPENVLSILNTEIGLNAVCSGPDVDDPRFDSFSRSLAAILRRQQMLRAIHEPNLIQLRNSCLSHLDQAKLEVAAFFDHEE